MWSTVTTRQSGPSVLGIRAALILSLTATLPVASAFSFAFQNTNSTLQSCQSVEVVWQGGQPPFELLIIPAYDYPQNITIPDTSWDADTQSGSYTWQVNYPTGVNLVAMMSDATADGAGGVTSLYNVEGENGNCAKRSTSADFTFQLNSTYINQCEPIDISWSAYATAPVKILGVIPHGQAFMMSSANSNSLLRWVPNLAQGTVFILAAFDAGKYGTGGSSNTYTVSQGSSACMDEYSPSSTAGNPVMTSGSTTRPGNGTTGNGDGTGSGVGGVKTVTAIATVYPSEGGGKGLSTGSIVGIVIAIVLTLLVTQAILLWFCCRRQIAALISHRRDMRKKGIKNGEVDLAATTNDQADHDIDLDPTYQMEQANGTFPFPKSDSRPHLDALDTGSDGISPFRDPSVTGRTGLPLLPNPNADPFWSGISPSGSGSGSGSHSGTAHAMAASSDNLSLMPPEFPMHIRADSMDSGRTFGMSSRAGSQQDLLPPSGPYDPYDSPQSSPITPPAGAGSSGQLGQRPSKANLVAQFEREERARQMEQQRLRQQSSSTPGGAMGTQPMRAANTGIGAAAGPQGDVALIETSPMMAAPRGGFNRHQDAGPVVPPPASGEGEVEDLPPLYNAEWNSQSGIDRR